MIIINNNDTFPNFPDFKENNIKSSRVNKEKQGRLLIPNAVKIPTEKLEIFYIDNFLDNDECKHLIKMI